MDNSRRKIRKRRKVILNRIRLLFLCICCIISFFLGVLSNNIKFKDTILSENRQSKINDLVLKGKRIVVDAGHGGSDCGTIGTLTGVYESELNLKISYKLKGELEKLGATVVMTRTEESTNALENAKKLQISERGKIIENVNPDMVLSIHQNFNEESSSIRGVQILCSDRDSVELATSMQEAFNVELDRRMSYIMDNYRVLMFGNQPSVIIECGFFSNKEDEKLLQTDEYQNRIIKIICKQVKEHLIKAN